MFLTLKVVWTVVEEVVGVGGGSEINVCRVTTSTYVVSHH